MSKKLFLLLAIACLVCAFASTGFADAASFEGLGDLGGGDFHSKASAVSANGSVVVGVSNSASGDEAFRWENGVMLGLGDLPGGDFYSEATGVSHDGSVVVGYSKPDWPGLGAFRWTESEGMQLLGTMPGGTEASEALGVSNDGSVIVGLSSASRGTAAFRWTETGGFQDLGYLPGGDGSYYADIAQAVSADGSVIVGGDNSTSSNYKAFRWTQAEGMVEVGPFSYGPYWNYTAFGVSANGSAIVGDVFTGVNYIGFRWTAAEGMIDLGDLPGGDDYSRAYDVSADGSVVVGRSKSALGQEAFIWDPENHMRNLKTVLQNDCGLDLTGWTLERAYGISDDGLTIVGYGINPDGYTEAWVATIPEPATLLLFGLGAVLLKKRI